MNAARLQEWAVSITTSVLMIALGSCADQAGDPEGESGATDTTAVPMATDPGDRDLEELRRVTAGFTDIEAARAAGYTEQITTCWYHRDQGGQGYHFGRPDLIDGNVSLLEPELVMYEPMADSTFQFVGVEYIVPFDQWTQPQPPTLLGRTFLQNEQLRLHVLHVWLGKENPTGMYENWNPTVSCEHAAESEDRA